MNKTFMNFALFFAISALAFGGTRDPDVPDEEYLEYGKKFDNVVLVRVVDFEGSVVIDGHVFKHIGFAEASAVIIRPNWAVTAGHVVHDSKKTTIKKKEKEYQVGKVIIHKEYKHHMNGVYDIALCYCPEDFELDEYVELYRKEDELGKKVDISGFGRPGDFKTGAGNFDGNRRAGNNKIDAMSSDIIFCSPGLGDKMPLEFMITPGDSGGGLFIDGKLAGINSFLRSHNPNDGKGPLGGRYGQESAFMRMSKLAEWVDLEIKKHELTLVKTNE